MKKSIKSFINKILGWAGFAIHSVYSAGRMFPESLEILKTVLPRVTFTVVDVGVAEGTPELYAAFPPHEHRYLLIEASPLYSSRVEELGRELGATVEKVFCGDHNGQESFIPRTASTAAKGSKYSRKRKTEPDRVSVESATLDSLIEKHHLSPPYVVKIDVEGAEIDVLRGAEHTLRATEAVIVETPIVLRMHGSSSFGDIVTILTEHGFALFDIAEMSYDRRNRYLNLANGIFVRKDNPLWDAGADSKWGIL